MNMKREFALFLTLLFLSAVCLRAQDSTDESKSGHDSVAAKSFALHLSPSPDVQDTTPPPDFVNVDQMPQVISPNIPEYPQVAKRDSIEGRVYVKLWIDKEGLPRKGVVLRSDNAIFNQPSIDAAMKYRFRPAIYRDNPVAVWVVIPFNYKLKPSLAETSSDTALVKEYRKQMTEMAKALTRSESYEEMIKKYDLAMYYERRKQYAKALQWYEEFVKQSKDFPNSPEEMVRYANMMIKKYSKLPPAAK